VDDPAAAVDGRDLAVAALVGAADDGDLVILADGDGADLVFGGVLGGRVCVFFVGRESE
jgi:hypothetical protein